MNRVGCYPHWAIAICFEEIFNRSLAESSRPISCSLWHSWSNSFVGNL